MPIDPGFIERVKQANPIEDVVNSYTKIRPHGPHLLKGRCCFHQEDTPSLAVYTETQTFYCYGCQAGKGGSDVISFIMKIEGLNFNDAVMFLARRAGLEYVHEPHKKALYDTLFERSRQYYRNLRNNKAALDYLHSRGVTDETIKLFRLGFCDERFLPGDRINPYYNRIIFPLLDLQMRTIGFAGRSLDDTDGRKKYHNDSTSEIFQKGNILYQMPLARRAIQENGRAYIVEGYFDVILLHQSGIHNVVSLMGTSFTDGQVELLKRYTDDVVLVMDGDRAGTDAMLRYVTDLRDTHELNVQVVALPMGLDPADMVQRMKEPNAMAAWLSENTVSVERFQVGEVLRSAGARLTEIRSSAVSSLLPILAQVDSPVILDELTRWCSHVLTIGRQSLLDEIARYRNRA